MRDAPESCNARTLNPPIPTGKYQREYSDELEVLNFLSASVAVLATDAIVSSIAGRVEVASPFGGEAVATSSTRPHGLFPNTPGSVA